MSFAAKGAGTSSTAMAVARIAVGIMFIMFGQYKVLNRDFAHGGYQKYVTGFVQESAVRAYKPFLRGTLHYPIYSGYAVGVAELLIGFSMLLGLWVRPFSVVGGLFMINLLLSTWRLPAGAPAWRYLGNQLENIPLLLLFVIFFVHSAGATLGLDGRRSRSATRSAAAT